MADIISDDVSLYLPPGFRFYPTDEEIITNYLSEKVADQRFTAVAMGEVDLNTCEPWDLPRKAKMGEKVWYFFCQKDRKYPTGTRTNRATAAGYWKATGKDKEIYDGRRRLVGMKKTLVFYKGRAPKGEKTNWVMHEFRLEGDSHYYILPQSSKEEWVVCRVFHKSDGAKKNLEEPAMNNIISPNFNQIPLRNQQENDDQYFSFPQIPPPNPNFFAPSSSAFMGQCKVEPISNSVATRSQETGMSGDWHGEISSNSTGNDSFLDLENIWDY